MLRADPTQRATAFSVGLDIVLVSQFPSSDELSSIWVQSPSQSQEAVRKRGNSKGETSAPITRMSFASVVLLLVKTERYRGDETAKMRQAQRDDASIGTLIQTSPVDSDLIPRRVLFLGAKSDTIPGAPPSIEDVAKGLLKNLIDIRKNCSERPIVFVGHKTGIVVIERTLKDSSKGGNLESQVFRRTAGIIYLSSNSSEHQSSTERRSDHFEITGKMMPSQVNSNYKGLCNKKYIEKRLEDFRALVEETDKTALEAYGAGPLETCIRHSAISLFPPSYFNGPKRTRMSMFSEAITVSLNCYRLLSAACRDNVEELRSILADGVNVNIQDCNGNTALHIAAGTGHIEAVKVLLVDYEANVVLQNSKGRDALSFALGNERNKVGIVNLLLKKGAKFKDEGKNALSNLPRASQELKDLLEHPPFIEGPQDDSDEEVWQTPIAPESAPARDACHSSRAVVAEFFEIGKQEKFVLETPTIDELLYTIGPEKILQEARSRAMSKDFKDKDAMNREPNCRWYHIPANNVSADYFYGRD